MAGINLVLTGCGDVEGVTMDYVVSKNETLMVLTLYGQDVVMRRESRWIMSSLRMKP